MTNLQKRNQAEKDATNGKITPRKYMKILNTTWKSMQDQEKNCEYILLWAFALSMEILRADPIILIGAEWNNAII